MRILILTAMKEELNPIITKINVEQIKSNFYNEIYTNDENKNTLFFSYTGIGKTNAAMSTTLLIQELKLDLIVNLGTAGGINSKIKILDLVVADKLAYHDVDVTGFGYELGQIPQSELYFKTAKVNNLLEKLEQSNINYHVGTIVSGDQFINDKNKQINISQNFNKVYAVEMESTAITHVCNKLNVNILVIRGISDLAHSESTVEFDKYLEEVSIKFNKIVELLKIYE